MRQSPDFTPAYRPLLRLARDLSRSDPEAAGRLLRQLQTAKKKANVKSDLLSHTEVVSPKSNETFTAISRSVLPKVVEYGALLFGETLRWGITGMWVNALEKGGHQALHTHANSFVSGVVFLTAMHSSARTMFHRPMGNPEFNFANNHGKVEWRSYNSPQWVMPDAGAGDLILFPSYMLHAVPRNEGAQRISVAFNAIPEHLDSSGYRIRFS